MLTANKYRIEKIIEIDLILIWQEKNSIPDFIKKNVYNVKGRKK
jgi:hypothetical protein